MTKISFSEAKLLVDPTSAAGGGKWHGDVQFPGRFFIRFYRSRCQCEAWRSDKWGCSIEKRIYFKIGETATSTRRKQEKGIQETASAAKETKEKWAKNTWHSKTHPKHFSGWQIAPNDDGMLDKYFAVIFLIFSILEIFSVLWQGQARGFPFLA